MAESTVVRTKKDVVIVIQDEAAALSYTVSKWHGDFAYEAALYDLVDVLDNGDLDIVREGDQKPVTLSFTTHLADIGDVATLSYTTIVDVCEEKGYWAANMASTQANATEVPTLDVVVTVDGTVAGETDKTMTFDDMILRGSATFGYPAAYAVTGRSATSTKPTVA